MWNCWNRGGGEVTYETVVLRGREVQNDKLV